MTDKPEPPPEDTDTSAAPPEREEAADAAAPPAPAEPPMPVEPPKPIKPVIDDVVASLIDEKPSRPHLTVVPPAPEAKEPARPKEVDPLAVVLDHGQESKDEPDTLHDAWAKAKQEVNKLDLGKILDFGGLATGLRQLAGWVEKQIPTINHAVTRFIDSVEQSLKAEPPVDEAGKPDRPPIAVVPDPEPNGEGDAKVSEDASAGGHVVTGPFTNSSQAAAIQEPPPPMGDPQPEPGPAPIRDPEVPPDPNPGTDPLPMGDPPPQRDPNPDPDRAPVRDPIPTPEPNPGPGRPPMRDPDSPLTPDPGRDPLPIGDPVPMQDPNPGRDPLPMGDPVGGRGDGASGGAGGSSAGSPGGDGNGDPDKGDPFATD